MKFKGTKGKWNTMASGGLGVPYIVYVDDETIFQCYNSFSNQDAKHNALLISKAPEMLEMLTYLYANDLLKDKQDEVLELIKQATEI